MFSYTSLRITSLPSFTSRGLEKCRHHRRRRRRGSIRRSRLRSRVNASGRPYLPTTTRPASRRHIHPVQESSGGRRVRRRASERANEHQQPAAVRVPTLSRRRTRARVLDRLRPLIGFHPRPYKIAREGGGGGGGEQRRRRRENACDRRVLRDGGSGGDDLLSRAFARTRENSRDRRPTTRAAAKSGRFISVNASVESRRTRGRTERKRVKKKEEEDQEE